MLLCVKQASKAIDFAQQHNIMAGSAKGLGVLHVERLFVWLCCCCAVQCCTAFSKAGSAAARAEAAGAAAAAAAAVSWHH
jgi:hypothetical protein